MRKGLENILHYLFAGLPTIGANEAKINAARMQRNLPPRPDISESWKGHLILCLGMPGFHPPRSLPPNVKLIGFLTPPAEDLSLILQSPGHRDLFSWMDNLPDSAILIYMAFGSHIKVCQQKVNRLLSELLSVDNVFVILANRDVAKRGDLSDPRVRIESWVPQQNVLNHHRIKLFLTHGGYGSIGDAIHAEVPTLFFPLGLDQWRNAYSVEDAKAGLVCSRGEPFKIRNQLLELLRDFDQYKSAVRGLRILSETAGGKREAARQIHCAINVGSAHLVSAEDTFSFAVRYNLDILFMTVGLAALTMGTLYMLISSLCGQKSNLTLD